MRNNETKKQLNNERVKFLKKKKKTKNDIQHNNTKSKTIIQTNNIYGVNLSDQINQGGSNHKMIIIGKKIPPEYP